MALYHNILRKLKENGSVEFCTFVDDNASIILKVIDGSDETITLLTEWRNKFWDAFPVKFYATENGTRKWLKEQVMDKDDRILFMIYLNGNKIGHIGTYRYDVDQNSAEIDNVVRAVRGTCPGLMEKVTMTLLDWMFTELKLSKVRLKVFSDNYKAINLYERCGMLTVDMIPLKQIITNDGWKWEEINERKMGEYPDRYFSIMEITKNDYFETK